MSRTVVRSALLSFALAVSAVVLIGQGNSRTPIQPTVPNTEWRTWGGDLKNTRYSPLDQIGPSNFSKLELAWRFKVDSLGPTPEYRLEGTPLVVGGVLYATGGTRRAVVALGAATGELLWVHREDEGPRADTAPRKLSGRGLSYWSDGTEGRILYVTPGYQLVALDATTGNRVSRFGRDGIVDLKLDDDQQIDLVHGEIGLHATPLVVKDVVVVGAAFLPGFMPKTFRNVKGYVRGFDVRTGRRMWIFHTIPQAGELGNETWEKDSWAFTGNTGVWTQMAADEDLGTVYLPVESATGDNYGGHRPGANLFGESLVALDIQTGKRKWHFQLVHHGIWDHDIAVPPLLADITVNGRAIKAVAQATKQNLLFVFDRVTGTPVWPIEERAVEKGDVPGEWYSPTQPIPTRPAAYGRNGVTVDDLIDFTPGLKAEAVKVASRYKLGPIYTPPSVSNPTGTLGTLTLATAAGGSNWPGGSYDPDTHMFYVYACDACPYAYGLVRPPNKEASDMDFIQGRAQGSAGDGLTVLGLPLIKPPYGTISAINLDKGEIVWQIAHGETPDTVRNHPALKDLQIPRTGQISLAATLATKTLLISGDPGFSTSPSGHRGAMLRAYDKATGREVGAVDMPAAQSGSPITYMFNGRQYIVVAVGGGAYSGEYLAFRLPS
jgi:quinoprotein glucose dehydrogenase